MFSQEQNKCKTLFVPNVVSPFVINLSLWLGYEDEDEEEEGDYGFDDCFPLIIFLGGIGLLMLGALMFLVTSTSYSQQKNKVKFKMRLVQKNNNKSHRTRLITQKLKLKKRGNFFTFCNFN